ncbi:MAG: hypothetical protein ABIH03_04005, partial [Pseudomonadota bacterium]
MIFHADTIGDRFDSNADPALIAWFIELVSSRDPAFRAKFVAHLCTHDFMGEVNRIKCLTLIVAAGADRIGHASVGRL